MTGRRGSAACRCFPTRRMLTSWCLCCCCCCAPLLPQAARATPATVTAASAALRREMRRRRAEIGSTARLLCAHSLVGGLVVGPVSRVRARLTGFRAAAWTALRESRRSANTGSAASEPRFGDGGQRPGFPVGGERSFRPLSVSLLQYHQSPRYQGRCCRPGQRLTGMRSGCHGTSPWGGRWIMTDECPPNGHFELERKTGLFSEACQEAAAGGLHRRMATTFATRTVQP